MSGGEFVPDYWRKALVKKPGAASIFTGSYYEEDDVALNHEKANRQNTKGPAPEDVDHRIKRGKTWNTRTTGPKKKKKASHSWGGSSYTPPNHEPGGDR